MTEESVVSPINILVNTQKDALASQRKENIQVSLCSRPACHVSVSVNDSMSGRVTPKQLVYNICFQQFTT